MPKYAALAAIALFLSPALCSSAPVATDDTSTFSIQVYVTPIAPNVTSGATAYQAEAWIQDTRLGDGGDPSSAIVTVNGVRLSQVPDNSKCLFSAADIGVFSEGDEVAISVEYAKIGTIARTLKVPPPVKDFSLDPPLPMGALKAAIPYEMSWTPTEGASYAPGCGVLNSDSNRAWSKSIYFNDDSHAYPASEFIDEEGKPYPYLDFTLLTLAKAELKAFSAGSFFVVAGIDRVLKKNYDKILEPSADASAPDIEDSYIQ